MIDALLRESDLRGRVLDFGCGDGVFSERAVRAGASLLSIDVDPTMVTAARARLDAIDGRNSVVRQGGVSALADVAPASIDTLLALNVLAYLNEPEVTGFYRHAQRVLLPGGVLVVTHSNELFDLFTLNRYTVAFFRRHFATHAAMDRVDTLLVNPDKPERFVFPCRENPLSYRHTLAQFELEEQQQEFAIFHPLPPLLVPGFDPDDLASREYPETIGWPESERWKLMFMCSVFGSRAVRTGQA
jgi:cyclopropane fatty-acyl-phospholipid synthase-like methyltransferase